MFQRAQPVSLLGRLIASVISALAVAFVVHLVTIFAFFLAGQAATGTLERYNALFLPGTLIVFVVLTILGLVRAFEYWFFALPAGLLAGVLGALIGTTIYVSMQGTAVNAQLFPAIIDTLAGANLIFVVAAIVATPSVGIPIWKKAVAFQGGATHGRRIALVRLPAANLSEGQVTHIERRPIDSELADAQWDKYLEAFTDNGWTISEAEPTPDLPDSVFIEDTMVVLGRLAVIGIPGSESRRGEIEGAEKAITDLGLRHEHIVEPGTLDGGDVLKVGTTIYVGRGGRTNAEGIRQLRAIGTRLGYTVVAVPITKVLHLKSAVTALPDGTIIGYPPLVDDISVFDRFLAMPEESGAHVVVLSDDTVLMAASAPKSAELISELGYRVVTVDISEYEKLEGCVTCLSVRVR